MQEVHTGSGKIFADIKLLLPRIAKEFNITKEELIVQESCAFPGSYMSGSYRDHCYKTDGPIEGMPLVCVKGSHSKSHQGYGLFYYRTRNDNLTYCKIVIKNDYNDYKFYVMPKNMCFRIHRNARRQNILNNKKNLKPTLAPGLLDDLIKNTVGFLKQSKEIAKYGVQVKRGIILDGPPGNGKTMACRYIKRLCTESSIDFGTITTAEIDKAYADRNLNELFQKYSLTFFDDIDISYLNRSKGNGKLACSLLTAMDGMSQNKSIIRIFTTNEAIKELDSAFTRPGRIDRAISFNKPDSELREKLINEWPVEIRNSIDTDKLLIRTRDFSFAELEAIRTFLVTNKILTDCGWNLDKAFDDFTERKKEKSTTKQVGFGSA